MAQRRYHVAGLKMPMPEPCGSISVAMRPTSGTSNGSATILPVGRWQHTSIPRQNCVLMPGLSAIRKRVMYRQLDARRIVDTARTLQRRVSERFPDSGLSQLCAELLSVAEETLQRMRWIQKPHVLLRVVIYILLGVILVLFGALFETLRGQDLREIGTFVQVLEAGLSSMFFIGAAVLFLFTWESRIKRNRALKAIHELRAMAHIVDMHQLTKDPDAINSGRRDTASSPKRPLSRADLGRYLNYCSEALSLLGKVAALYSQGLEDSVVLDAVDDVEDLTTELSQKVWQKIAMLDKTQAEFRAMNEER